MTSIMERPADVPEAAWTTLDPATQAAIVAALQRREERVRRETLEATKLTTLLKVGHADEQPSEVLAKRLLRASTVEFPIFDTLRRLKDIQALVERRAAQVPSHPQTFRPQRLASLLECVLITTPKGGLPPPTVRPSVRQCVPSPPQRALTLLTDRPSVRPRPF